MTNRCATCLHWTAVDMTDQHTIRYRQLATERVRECDAPGLRFAEAPGTGEATVVDHEEYAAHLLTDADFGCTLWKAKP